MRAKSLGTHLMPTFNRLERPRAVFQLILQLLYGYKLKKKMIFYFYQSQIISKLSLKLVNNPYYDPLTAYHVYWHQLTWGVPRPNTRWSSHILNMATRLLKHSFAISKWGTWHHHPDQPRHPHHPHQLSVWIVYAIFWSLKRACIVGTRSGMDIQKYYFSATV